jgi:hypothetical protein
MSCCLRCIRTDLIPECCSNPFCGCHSRVGDAPMPPDTNGIHPKAIPGRGPFDASNPSKTIGAVRTMEERFKREFPYAWMSFEEGKEPVEKMSQILSFIRREVEAAREEGYRNGNAANFMDVGTKVTGSYKTGTAAERDRILGIVEGMREEIDGKRKNSGFPQDRFEMLKTIHVLDDLKSRIGGE